MAINNEHFANGDYLTAERLNNIVDSIQENTEDIEALKPTKLPSAPTDATSGNVGQTVLVADGTQYICKGKTEDGKFIWKKIIDQDALDEAIQTYITNVLNTNI